MKNNVFEEDRTIRAEKEDNKSTQEKPKMVRWLPRSSPETPKSSQSDAKSTPRARQEEPKKDLTTSTLTAMPRCKNLEFSSDRRNAHGAGGKEGWHSVTEGWVFVSSKPTPPNTAPTVAPRARWPDFIASRIPPGQGW